MSKGRFAPSPTGQLHLGSLMAAVASYLNVKAVAGQWLVRIDDLDTPRVVTGSDQQLIKVLEVLGFEWDGVVWQSQRLAVYEQALANLVHQGLVYACDCSRAQCVQRMGRSGCYDNHCRHRLLSSSLALRQAQAAHQAIRLISPETQQAYHDLIQGKYEYDWSALGDVILCRADGIYSYHLACAVDDADFGMTEVVRGYDLLHSTPPQRVIQQYLAKASPDYAHYPILLSEQGVKLSKASNAPAVDVAQPVALLYQVLCLLEQAPPKELRTAELSDLWAWAIAHWQLSPISALSHIQMPSHSCQ